MECMVKINYNFVEEVASILFKLEAECEELADKFIACEQDTAEWEKSYRDWKCKHTAKKEVRKIYDLMLQSLE